MAAVPTSHCGNTDLKDLRIVPTVRRPIVMRDTHIKQLRARIAQQAARLMHEQGIRDPDVARRKAARLLDIRDAAALPRQDEIEQALRSHLFLFDADQPARLLRLRQMAVEAMTFLASFQPRLVGAVLDGTAGQHAAVSLHLFTDQADAPGQFLTDHAIPHERSDRAVRMADDRRLRIPVLGFSADGVPFELTVFPLDGLRQAPLDPVDRRPMARASLGQVRALIEPG